MMTRILKGVGSLCFAVLTGFSAMSTFFNAKDAMSVSISILNHPNWHESSRYIEAFKTNNSEMIWDGSKDGATTLTYAYASYRLGLSAYNNTDLTQECQQMCTGTIQALQQIQNAPLQALGSTVRPLALGTAVVSGTIQAYKAIRKII